MLQLEDNPKQGSEYASKVARIMVKLGMYDKATDAIRREIGFHQSNENTGSIGRLAVALVLVQLARGDTVAAEKAFKEWGNCCDPEEVSKNISQMDREDLLVYFRCKLWSSFCKASTRKIQIWLHKPSTVPSSSIWTSSMQNLQDPCPSPKELLHCPAKET